jgi:enoyl-[acyl-carrier-protein] reductase (NADH)
MITAQVKQMLKTIKENLKNILVHTIAFENLSRELEEELLILQRLFLI